MRQLGEIFIGVACYGKDNKIIVDTKVFNVCKNVDPTHIAPETESRICSLFYNTVEEEKILKLLLNKEDLSTHYPDISADTVAELKKVYTGYNDYETTSFVSNFIRHRTVTKACEFAREFVELHKNNIVYPRFLKNTKATMLAQLRSVQYSGIEKPNFSIKSNNLILNETEDRLTYVPNIIIPTTIDTSRRPPADPKIPKNSYLFKGGHRIDKISILYRKYKKYKLKYLKSKQKSNK